MNNYLSKNVSTISTVYYNHHKNIKLKYKNKYDITTVKNSVGCVYLQKCN